MEESVTRRANIARRDQNDTPLLSIVVPFYAYDASALAHALVAMAVGQNLACEIIFADDGSSDTHFGDIVYQVFCNSTVPSLLLSFKRNLGRAAIRNQLAKEACGRYLLYLDADMMPDEEDFLAKYVRLAKMGDVDIVYGGRSVKHVKVCSPALNLHKVFTHERESLPAEMRRENPAYHFYSCNFLVRKEIILAVPIDERFTGWGWEDCEWAARASDQYRITHIDNPATHLGLLDAEKIILKYEESIGNFTLIRSLQPGMIVGTSIYKAARLIRQLRIGWVVRKISRRCILSSSLPVKLRLVSLMLYKASLYEKVV